MCGIVGGYQPAETLISYLSNIQHRGFCSCGLVTDAGAWHATGPVHDLTGCEGNYGIGHVRYTTNNDPKSIQPVISGRYAMAFNGHVEDGDTSRLFTALIDNRLRDIRGAYCLLFKDADRLYAARDPHGFHPLFYNYEHSMVASEPVANLGLQWQEIEPGTMISVMSGHAIDIGTAEKSNCFFEDVYFSHVSSHWCGRSVYDIRKHYGRILAGREDVDADAVVPVPNSGIAAAEAIAETLGLPLRLGICQNRYSPRTFIAERGQIGKYVLTPEALRGKLLIVDDSIVRGSTMRLLVPMLKKYATEVHLRITCPKITHPCRYGVNITGAGAHSIEGADSLRFLEPDDLVPDTCRACVTGTYPNGEKDACTICTSSS